MKNFEEIFHSSGEVSAKRLGSNLQKKLTRKPLVVCFISVSLQLYFFPSCDCIAIDPGKREICIHVSVMYSHPFPSMLMTVLRRIHVRNAKLSLKCLRLFCRVGKPWMYEGGDGKNCKTFPHIPDEPSKLQNFSPSKLLSFTVYFCL